MCVCVRVRRRMYRHVCRHVCFDQAGLHVPGYPPLRHPHARACPQARLHARPPSRPYVRTHARTHARMHTRTHARTHAHTHAHARTHAHKHTSTRTRKKNKKEENVFCLPAGSVSRGCTHEKKSKCAHLQGRDPSAAHICRPHLLPLLLLHRSSGRSGNLFFFLLHILIFLSPYYAYYLHDKRGLFMKQTRPVQKFKRGTPHA